MSSEQEVHAMLRADIEEARISFKTDFEVYRREVSELHRSLMTEIKSLKVLVMPMIDNYSAAVKIARWTSKTLVFFSVLIGVVISLYNFLKHKLTP